MPVRPCFLNVVTYRYYEWQFNEFFLFLSFNVRQIFYFNKFRIFIAMTKNSFLCLFLDSIIKNEIKMEDIKHEKKSDYVNKVLDEAHIQSQRK